MTFIDKLAGLFTKKEVGWQTFFGYESDNKTRSTSELYFGLIFSCIDAIANAVSEIKWGLYRKKTNGEYEEVLKHPVLDILKKPNSLQTSTDFLYLMSAHIDTNGQAFIYPVGSGLNKSRLLEIHLLSPSGVSTATNQDKPIVEITGYKYTKAGKIFSFKPNELINVIRPNPFNQAQGISTIQMARFDGTNELNAIEMNNAFYDNGAYPGGVIKTDEQLNPDVFAKLKSKIKEQYEGKKNAFRMMFLTHGLNYQQVTPSQRDMEYVEQRRLNRDQILSIFKVPKSMVAVSDAVNRATAEAENMAFARNVVKPRLELIFDKLNMFFLPLFPGTEGLELRFENPIKDDQEYLLKAKTASVNTWKTVNEIRAEEGLEPIEGGDELSSTKQPENSDEQDAPPQDGKDDEDEKDDQEDSKKKELGHIHKESPPDPKDATGKLNQEYIRRKNRYVANKEKSYSLALNQHYSFLVRDIRKSKMTKDVAEDFEWSEEVVFSKVMPEEEKRREWQILLLLLLVSNNTQVWKTAVKQMSEIYGYTPNFDDLKANFISQVATKTASGISQTVFKRVREIINQNLKEGVRDLSTIKAQIADLLLDQKQWKVDQIARTEIANAYAEAQMQMYRDNHVEKLIWLVGSAPCPVCAQNANAVVKTGQAFPSGHSNIPVHPNCACDVTDYPY